VVFSTGVTQSFIQPDGKGRGFGRVLTAGRQQLDGEADGVWSSRSRDVAGIGRRSGR
jgi:hypothetical protein